MMRSKMLIIQQNYKSFHTFTVDGNKFLALHCNDTTGDIAVFGVGIENFGRWMSEKEFRKHWKTEGNKLELTR